MTARKIPRKVTAVEETSVELPEITRIGFLNTKEETTSTDAFARPAEDLRALAGLGSTAKRRITTRINKYQRSVANDAGTKQVLDKEFFSGYDAFEVVQPPHNLDALAKLYDKSEPHMAAVNAKVANIVGLGFNFVETRKTKRALQDAEGNEAKSKKLRRTLDIHKEELEDQLQAFNDEDAFEETLTKVWRDYECTGNGYLEIGRKKDGTIGYIGHIPSQTMRIRRKRDGFIQMGGSKVQFFHHFGHGSEANPLGGGKANEVIHFKKYSPSSGYYGVPEIVSAMNAVAGNEFAERFNLDYFENKAIPRYAVILKGATLGNQAEERLLSFFQTGLKGQNHRSIYIPLPASTTDQPVDIKFEAIEAGIQDSSFLNYTKNNRVNILMAHRVPETKVSVSTNVALALARDADKTFKEQVCAPEQKIAERKLNKPIKELTDAFEFKLNEMTLTDADTQSKIDEREVKAGIVVPNEVRARRGVAGIKGGDEKVDLNAKANNAAAQNADSNANRQRNSTRSANATDSAGEGRNPKGEGRTTS